MIRVAVSSDHLRTLVSAPSQLAPSKLVKRLNRELVEMITEPGRFRRLEPQT